MAAFDPAAARSSQCTGCGRRARVVPNPYYGVKLSVHEHLLVCDACGRTAFVSPTPVRIPPPPAEGRWERLAKRLRRQPPQ